MTRSAPPSSSRGCAGSSTAATTRPGSRVHTTAARHRDRARGRQAREPRRRAEEEPARRARRASATRAGRRTAGRAKRTRTRTSPATSPSSTTASSRTTSRCAASSRREGVKLLERHRHRDRRAPRRRGARRRRAHALVDAVRAALQQVRGAYAIAVVVGDAPDEIVVAQGTTRRSSSASATARCSAASDIPALLAHTRDVIFLEDGEMAVLTRDGRARSRRSTATPVHARAEAHRLVADPGREGRLQALHAQGDPRAAARDRGHAARPRRSRRAATSSPRRSASAPELAKKIGRVYFVACGTSAHAAMAGRYWIEQLARIPATVEIGSEVRYREPVFMPRRPRRRRQPERRDAGHARRGARRRRPRARTSSRSQRARQRDPARGRRRALHARRPRDRRRLDEVLHDAARRAAHARGLPRPPARHALSETEARASSRRSGTCPQQMRDVLAQGRGRHAHREEAPARARHALPRTRHAASRSRSRARSSSRRSRTSTPRATPPAR